MLREKNKYILIVLIYLSAQNFFNPMGVIPASVSKGIFVSLSILAILMAYRKKGMNTEYPKGAYRFLILGILIASIMASAFHSQPYDVSLVAILPYLLGYLYFFVLGKYRVDIQLIEKALRLLTICSLGMYLTNLACFPNKIFGESQEEYDMSRGFVRLGVPMIEIVVTYFFYSINKWMIFRKKKDVYWIILTTILIFMSLTRQVIALSAILGFLFVMQKANWFKKMSVIACCLFVTYFVLPQIPMVKTMIELSEQQSLDNKNDEDIRVTAWRFYTTEFQANEITPFLGNGVPAYGKSKWGNFVEQTTALRSDGGNACFTVDVGWAGFFWYFGGVATFGLILMFWKGIIRKKRTDKLYLSYSLAFVAISAVASGPILFYSQICSVSLLFYLAYAKENSDPHPQLQ